MKSEIIKYLDEKYNPLSIILYGSYASNTNNFNSDFDCMIIVNEKTEYHDASIVAGVMLDCFIFTIEDIKNKDIDEFTNIYDGEIVKDNGIGLELKNKVLAYIEENSVSSDEDKDFIKKWVLKTISRFERNDSESKFRGIMLLNESLEDYYLFRDMFFHGPKKAIIYLENNDKEGFKLFNDCLNNTCSQTITKWMKYVVME